MAVSKVGFTIIEHAPNRNSPTTNCKSPISILKMANGDDANTRSFFSLGEHRFQMRFYMPIIEALMQK
jgi:hypothetical protein